MDSKTTREIGIGALRDAIKGAMESGVNEDQVLYLIENIFNAEPPKPAKFVPPEIVIANTPNDEGFYVVYIGDFDIDRYKQFDERLKYFRRLAHGNKVGQKGIEWLRSFEGESDKECGPAEDIIDEWDKGNEI